MRVSTGGFGISFIYPPRNHPDLTCRSRACCEKEMEGIRTNETGSVSVKTHGAIFIYLNLIWIEKLLPIEIYLPNMDTDPVYDTVSSNRTHRSSCEGYPSSLGTVNK